MKRTDAIGGNDADRLDRSEPPEANDEDTLFGDLLAAGEPAAQDTASHSKVSPSERRNLCAFCPSGASVFQRSLLVKAFESIASVQYCCPAPSPATPLLVPRAKKPTKVSAARKATHIGLIYDDIDGNGMFTPGIDKPLPKKWVVLRSEGKVIAQIRTDGLGRYFFVGKAKPWTLLSVSLLRNPSNILDRIQTGRLGDTRALVAIPPPKLKGSAFYDLDLDGQKSATDKPATAIKLRVEFANGTIWKEVSTDANGKFGFIYHRRMPYKKLLLTTGNGKAKKQVQLDADGNGKGALAIPEKSGAVFSERRSTG